MNKKVIIALLILSSLGFVVFFGIGSYFWSLYPCPICAGCSCDQPEEISKKISLYMGLGLLCLFIAWGIAQRMHDRRASSNFCESEQN